MPLRDLPAAVRFYRDALGLPLLFEAPPGLAFFDCAGQRLLLAAPGGGGQPRGRPWRPCAACGGGRAMVAAPEGGERPRGNSVLYFTVPDVVAAHAALRGRGV